MNSHYGVVSSGYATENLNFCAIVSRSALNLYVAGVPYDGEPELEVLTVHPALTALVLTLTVAGTTFAIACMIFNFVYRNRRFVE
jgi:hypothetical protein